MALPRNIQTVRERLQEVGGSQDAAELKARLQTDGIVMSVQYLERLTEKYPDAFEFTDAGDLRLVDTGPRASTTPAAVQRTFDADKGEAWWTRQVQQDQAVLERSNVLAVWLEDPRAEPPNEGTLAAAWLDRPAAPTRYPDPEELLERMLEARAICLFQGRRTRHGVLRELITGLPNSVHVLEWLELCVVVMPALDDRSEPGIAEWCGRDPSEPESLVVCDLLDRFDPGEPACALAQRILDHGGHPWGALLPTGDVPEDLAEFMPAATDPLCGTDQTPVATSASSTADDVLRTVLSANPHFNPRPSQQQMARSVGEAMDQHSRLMVEAPTGTGKSLAYLAPAIGAAQQRPVVVSTHTKVLQNQLRDEAHRLQELGVLNVPFRQLVGVSNYVCARELVDSLQRSDLDKHGWMALAVAAVSLGATPSGQWAEVSDNDLRRSSGSYWSTRNSLRTASTLCEKHACPQAAMCPMMGQLHKIDSKPGIIVTNHALIAAWTAAEVEPDNKRSSAPSGILGTSPTVLVLDEAHRLEDSLASAWTSEVGAQRLASFAGWLTSRRGPAREAKRALQRADLPTDTSDAIDAAVSTLQAELEPMGVAAGQLIHEYGGIERSLVLMRFQRNWQLFRALEEAARNLVGALEALSSALRSIYYTAKEAGPEVPTYLTRTARKCWSAADRSDEFIETLKALIKPTETHRYVDVLHADEDAGPAPEDVATSWVFEHVPLQVGQMFRDQVLARADSIVLTSATLTVDNSFEFLAERLGMTLDEDSLASVDTQRLQSPFDHDRQSVVILTNHLALPTPAHQREFVEDLASEHVGFLSLSGGRSLSLFNSRERMELTAELAASKSNELAERGVRLLVQGAVSPVQISNQFLDDPGTALLGLRSYWEGFDAPGETLSYLLVEKPPYPHPGDVLEQARQRVVADRGGDPFLDYVVPRVAISMAQGVGRLLRHEDDRGAAIFYDRRMLSPGNANQMILNSLPTKNLAFPEDRESTWHTAIQFVTGEEPDLTTAIILQTDNLSDLLEECRLREGEDFEAGLREAASKLFNIEPLHDAQVELMLAVLQGRDALGVLPTGRGKSLCYQLPALVHPDQLPFVVVSPLVALIKDQVDDLRSRRGFRAVVGITGRTSVAERTEVLRDTARGQVRLLYVSPERLVRDPTLRAALAQQRLGGVVVDEAHCVSAWGHDFRPEFRQVSKAVEEMWRAPRMALTATATPEVADDIIETLAFEDPVKVREPTDRSELTYWRLKCSDDRHRTRELLRFVASQGGRPGIVYASRRALTEHLAWVLAHSGHRARAYHAGLLPEQRESTQEDFLQDNIQIVVATKAFGMGVNKPDIGWVLHYDLPDSLESYAQEAGRAARLPDLSATVALLWHGGDVARQKRHLSAEATFADPNRAREAVRQLLGASVRGNDVVADPESLAEKLDLEPDELNVLTAWLEQVGALRRLPDCSVRAAVTLGRTEPENPDERRHFFELLQGHLKCRLGSRRLIDLDEVAATVGITADALEEELIRWSLERHISFHATQRRWRIQIIQPEFDTGAFRKVAADWRALQKRRLDSVIAYAETNDCLRVAIAKEFGDAQRSCHDSGGDPCEVCSKTAPPWHDVPLDSVPDPELIVDVPLEVLRVVQWASRNTKRPFGAKTISAVALGLESVGGHPVSPAALRCPQFGVLKHVRSAQRRYDSAIDELTEGGLVEAFEVHFDGRTWHSQRTTGAGKRQLGEVG